MFCVELGGSYSPRRHWCFKQPDFGSKGPGPAYRLLMTFGNADDLAYEFATYCIATPGRPTQHSLEVCIETLIRSLRVPCTSNVTSGNASLSRFSIRDMATRTTQGSP